MVPDPRSMPDSPEALARFFHETYERLAPQYAYETREDSAVDWRDVPEKNRQLMIATASHVFALYQAELTRLRRVEEHAKQVAYVYRKKLPLWDSVKQLSEFLASNVATKPKEDA